MKKDPAAPHRSQARGGTLQRGRVGWPLTWVDDPLGPGSTEVSWRPHPPGVGVTDGVLLERGPLVAWWDGIEPGAVPSRGRLIARLALDGPRG